MHFNVAVGGGAVGWTPSAEAGARSPPGPFIGPAPASVDVTVVEETCLEPEDLLPLDEPTKTRQ